MGSRPGDQSQGHVCTADCDGTSATRSTTRGRYALVGGYAVALHGAVRGTIDIDIVLRWTLRDLEAAEAALGSIGLVSRLPVTAESVFRFRDEYIRNRNLIAWNFYNPQDLSERPATGPR